MIMDPPELVLTRTGGISSSSGPGSAPAASTARTSSPSFATTLHRKNNGALRKIIGVSTKMYFSAARTDSFIREVVDFFSCNTTATTTITSSSTSSSSYASTGTVIQSILDNNVEVFVVPDFVTLVPSIRTIQDSGLGGKIIVGAQDCWSQDSGAYTGEVSPSVLKEVGCGLVELGHAERKVLFGETDRDVSGKVRAVLRNGMVPLVCVGEVSRHGSLEEAGREVMGQVEVCLGDALKDIGTMTKERGRSSEEEEVHTVEVVLAYEPVWAIGANEPASAEYVKGVVRILREKIEKLKSETIGGDKLKVRFIYGGSAGPGLWEKLDGELDGLFLGRFAHDPEQFVRTVCEVAGVYRDGR